MPTGYQATLNGLSKPKGHLDTSNKIVVLEEEVEDEHEEE